MGPTSARSDGAHRVAPSRIASAALLALAASCGASDGTGEAERRAPRFEWAYIPGDIALEWTPEPTDWPYGTTEEAPRLVGKSSAWAGRFDARMGVAFLELTLGRDGTFLAIHHAHGPQVTIDGCGGPFVGQTYTTGTWSVPDERVFLNTGREADEAPVSFQGAVLTRDERGFVLRAGLGQDVYAD